MNKRITSIILAVVFSLTSASVIYAADFVSLVQSYFTSGSAATNTVNVPTSVGVRDNANTTGSYENGGKTFYNSSSATVDYRTTIDMSNVKESFNNYVTAAQTASAFTSSGIDIATELSKCNVKGQFVIEITYPSNANFVKPSGVVSATAMTGFSGKDGNYSNIFEETVTRTDVSNKVTVTVDVKSGVDISTLQNDLPSEMYFDVSGVKLNAVGKYTVDVSVTGATEVLSGTTHLGTVYYNFTPNPSVATVVVTTDSAPSGGSMSGGSSSGGSSGGNKPVDEDPVITIVDPDDDGEAVEIDMDIFVDGEQGGSLSGSELNNQEILPAKSDYEFEGFYYDPEFKQPVEDDDVINLDGNTQIYANFVEIDEDQDVEYIVDITTGTTFTYVKGTKIKGSSLKGTTLPGYKFKGYYYDSQFTQPVKDDDIFDMDESKQIYAKFDKIEDSDSTNVIDVVTEETDTDAGNSLSANKFIYVTGTKVKGAALPKQNVSGQVFLGYYYDPEFTQPVGDDVITMDGDKKIYAKFARFTLNTENRVAYIYGYPVKDGKEDVRPNGNITREEIAAIFYRLLLNDVREELYTTTNSFDDVSEDRWSNAEISTMANGRYVKGYEDGTFKPANPITRGEFVTIAARFHYVDIDTKVKSARFTDSREHWAKVYIDYAKSVGWLDGYDDRTFKPDQYITRAEAIKIINNMINRNGDLDIIEANAKDWADLSSSAWYYKDVLDAATTYSYTTDVTDADEVVETEVTSEEAETAETEETEVTAEEA